MKMHEYNPEGKRKLLFFPGSCEGWQEFEGACTYLAREFHVFQVIPDGHDPGEHTDFISVEKTVHDTEEYLLAEGIDHLDGVYGLSFGGAMVMCFLCNQKIPVRKAVIDAGTAPYQMPKLLCCCACIRDWLEFRIGIASTDLMALAFPYDRFARDREHAKEEYEELRQYLKTYSDRTVWNIFWSANNYKVPAVFPRMDTEIQFWVGDEEWGCRYRDLKWYRKYVPDLKVRVIPGMMHGELVMMHSKKFAERALTFFMDEKEGRDVADI